MKTIDYINSLIEEKENLKTLCKTHVETIRAIKRELAKLNTTIVKKDKKILKLETESPNVKTQKELDKVKNELIQLKAEYDNLLNKYNEVVKENTDLKSIFDEIENTCDSE